MPSIPIGRITEQLAKLTARARQREQPRALLESLGTQLRSLFRERRSALIHHTSPPATIQIATPTPLGNEAIAAHLATLVQKRLNRLVQTRHFEAAKDPVAAVHDLRVASRRLRAFVEVFHPILDSPPNEARKSLRAITRAARKVRDLHVQRSYLLDCYGQSTSDIECIVLEELMARTEARAKQEEQRLRKRLKRLHWTRVKRALSNAIGETITQLPATERAVSNLAWQLIEPLTRLPMARIQSGVAVEQPGELHDLRIMVKRLRYALEIFEPTFGSAFESFYEPVEMLQESLGHHHDLYVLENYVREQRIDLEHGGRTTLAQAMRVLEQKLDARRRALYEDVLAHGFDICHWQQRARDLLQQPSMTSQSFVFGGQLR